MKVSEIVWNAIFEKYNILKHDFNTKPYLISTEQINYETAHFRKSNNKNNSFLYKQYCREDRPNIFKKNNLFLLPVGKKQYALLKGEGYFDIPAITNPSLTHESILNFPLETYLNKDNMQHLDFAYASSLIRTFMDDDTLVLTIRGRKYTPEFTFKVGEQQLTVKGVQTEIDAGYEGKNQLVLIEAKNSHTNNVIIRQLFYPFRQWSHYLNKKVVTLFFEKRDDFYYIWLFEFTDKNNYNSIKLIKSKKFKINQH